MPDSHDTDIESFLNPRNMETMTTDLDKQIAESVISTPIVFAKDGAVLASSRDIAVAFGKDHRKVMRAIDNMLAQERSLAGGHFWPSEFRQGNNGTPHRIYEMNRDGFALLAMGFTGAKALKWKLAYIDAFNRMEQALHSSDGNLVRLDERGMSAIGGMLKGIIAKWERDKLPQLVDLALHQTQAAVSRGMTAGEAVEAAGITNRKGLRGLPRRVSDHLRRFFSERGVAVPLGHLGSTTAYVFEAGLVREWLMSGGKSFIERIAQEKRGQGSLKLVSK